MGIWGNILGTLFLTLFTTAILAAAPEKRFIIGYETGAERDVLTYVTGQGARVHHQLQNRRLLAVSLPESAIAALRGRHDVRLVEEDPKRYPQAQVSPYGISMIEANDPDEVIRKAREFYRGITPRHPRHQGPVAFPPT